MTVNVPTGGDTADNLFRGVFLFVHVSRLLNWLTKANRELHLKAASEADHSDETPAGSLPDISGISLYGNLDLHMIIF